MPPKAHPGRAKTCFGGGGGGQEPDPEKIKKILQQMALRGKQPPPEPPWKKQKLETQALLRAVIDPGDHANNEGASDMEGTMEAVLNHLEEVLSRSGRGGTPFPELPPQVDLTAAEEEEQEEEAPACVGDWPGRYVFLLHHKGLPHQ